MFANPYAVNRPVIPGTVIGSFQPQFKKQESPKPPEASLPRAINFYADYSGCGFWRMIWPEHVLNAYQHMVVHGTTVMCFDDRWYSDAKAIRIQRQATPGQLQFVKFLKSICEKQNIPLIYEIDDIVFREDIPDYNKFKVAFTSDEIRSTSQEIMSMCDEITVTCDFMRSYYMDKTGHKKVTVIPNFMPKFWMGHYYDEKKIGRLYEKHKKRPRILYPGSGAHFDVDRRVKGKDDFGHVIDTVIKTRKKYKWVFLGAYPLDVKQYIINGEMEFKPWMPLYEYPEAIHNFNANVLVAPLANNTFNKAKSDLKHIEAGAMGMAGVCQDLVTYKNAEFKFTTGDEMVDQIDTVMKDKTTFMKAIRRGRRLAESRWLESPDNIGMYKELYSNPYGHADRLLINKQNNL